MWSFYSAEKMSLICKKVFQDASIHAEIMHFVTENNKMVPACCIQYRQQGERAGRRRCRQGFQSVPWLSPPLPSSPFLPFSLLSSLLSPPVPLPHHSLSRHGMVGEDKETTKCPWAFQVLWEVYEHGVKSQLRVPWTHWVVREDCGRGAAEQGAGRPESSHWVGETARGC